MATYRNVQFEQVIQLLSEYITQHLTNQVQLFEDTPELRKAYDALPGQHKGWRNKVRDINLFLSHKHRHNLPKVTIIIEHVDPEQDTFDDNFISNPFAGEPEKGDRR